MKNVNIISIHYGHNASVALLQNGELKYCLSEERFNRIKNSTGFPRLSLEYILKKTDAPIDYYVLTQRLSWGYKFLKKHGFTSSPFNHSYSDKGVKVPMLFNIAPKYYMARGLKKIINVNDSKSDHEEMVNYFTDELKISKDKIIFLDHHEAHALSSYFFKDEALEEMIIFTLDGEGDGLCATVSVSKRGAVSVLSKNNRAFSLGYLYREVTAFLGMKPDEHEFKVMGLAPYAKPEHAERLLPVFKKLLWINDKNEFESKIPMPLVKYVLKEKLIYQRFDNIAGAIQIFTEELALDWIKRWIKKTGIKNIALSGGVFMNVKMNQRIAELPEVERLTIVPSAGDESTVIGGCYYGYKKFCDANKMDAKIVKASHLYLGNEYSESDLEIFLKENNFFEKYKITQPENMSKKMAELLSENKVVARYSGKMEFGARALGNRSILANPCSYENVKIINEMIKNRDFWMPFATSILEEDADKYIINPKKFEAPFMAITFNTTDLANKHLLAALHPYDKTSRPQIVKKETNPEYHAIISEFKNITGIGGILNTSFNLHGEPNVESPKDAMHTFENSGLDNLSLGKFLIQK